MLMLMMLFAVQAFGFTGRTGADADDARCSVWSSDRYTRADAHDLTGPTGALSFPSQADSS